ncbi:MAG: hypothetical protein WCP01_15895 [Methylococcaceae bacterium]
MPVGVETRLKRLKASITFKTAGRVSDSVTRRIGAENVGLRYLATLNKLTRPWLAVLVTRSPPNKGMAHMLSNDSTRFRKACIFTTLRFVKKHALSLLGTTRLLSRSVRKSLAR